MRIAVSGCGPGSGAGSRRPLRGNPQSLERRGASCSAERSPIRTLGIAKVAVKNGFVVSARNKSAGWRWHAVDDGKRAWNLRLLTHIFVLGLTLPPLTVTVAQAQSGAGQHHRIVLDAALRDHPEAIRDIPADPPSPTPSPQPTPSPVARPVAVVRPAPPRPRPVYRVYATGPVADIIRAAAARYHTDANTLLRVAMCESHLNPNSYNARSGATGLFQFKPPTFYAHGGHNIWDPADQADVAARMFSQGLASAWSCK